MAKKEVFIFSRRNYSLILFSIVLLISGFLLMTGTGNGGAEQFNQDIYSFRRITLSPLVLIAGYALIIYAIMTRTSKNKNPENGR
jgi:hypothetical protein